MVSIGRNEVPEFHYASALDTTAQYIVPEFGTAAASLRKRVRITDLKVSVGGTARTMRISGQGGEEKDIKFNLPANSAHNFHWELPYPISAISSTGESRGIYASAAGTGVDIVVSGYVDYYGADV